MKSFFLLLFVLVSTSLYSQASWTYHWKFKILDHKGEIYNSQRIQKEKIQFFVLQNGAHMEGNLTFLIHNNQFNFSQHTISTDVVFVMICKNDTMVIENSTHNMDMGNIRIEKGLFKLPYWVSKKDYKCTKYEQDCRLLKPVNKFKKSNDPNWSQEKGFSPLKVKFSRPK